MKFFCVNLSAESQDLNKRISLLSSTPPGEGAGPLRLQIRDAFKDTITGHKDIPKGPSTEVTLAKCGLQINL